MPIKPPDNLGLKVGDIVEYENYWQGQKALIRGTIKFIGNTRPGMISGIDALTGDEHHYYYLILPITITYLYAGCGMDDISYKLVAAGEITFKKASNGESKP